MVEGEGRGRRLRIPTANLDVRNGCLPARGVYVSEARIDGRSYPAVTNVGCRPTFDGSDEIVVEAHLLEGGGDLYGDRVELAFLLRLRAERRFESGEELRAQIDIDIDAARAHFAATPARP